MVETDKIFTAIKEARKAQGLSQLELGARVGVPQSHISKIESGNVDIQLSSLTQIARALDFELQLVPKKALPAVQSIVRSTKPRSMMGMFQLGQQLETNAIAKALSNSRQNNKNLVVEALINRLHRPTHSLDKDDE
ncbi:MAG: helix-turn-helix transcriptional regulator [Devosiaceae bacterium]|nr:helix-turn-helix transcriptional regulator [Devosiaceae bacterium]